MIKEEKLRMCSNQKARLPDMSGIDVMKEIKDIAPSVLVIIVTAYGDEEVAVDAFRSDARDYLKKPFFRTDPWRRKNILPEPDKSYSAGNATFRRHPQSVT